MILREEVTVLKAFIKIDASEADLVVVERTQ
jgi:hypothetical protein